MGSGDPAAGAKPQMGEKMRPSWKGRVAWLLLLAVLPQESASSDPMSSTQGTTIGLHVERLQPGIDTEFGGPGPYQRIFGSGVGFVYQVNAAWTVLDAAGPLSLGIGAGYFGASGHGLMEGADGTWVQSLDQTTLKVIPLTLFLDYRWDGFGAWTGQPVVPFLRVGLERWNWWTTNGNGSTVGRGATNGLSVSSGLAISLDAVDQARDGPLPFRTWLLLDVTRSRINDFGARSSWDLSSRGWAFGAGLALGF
jgi:hypothetical protein